MTRIILLLPDKRQLYVYKSHCIRRQTQSKEGTYGGNYIEIVKNQRRFFLMGKKKKKKKTSFGHRRQLFRLKIERAEKLSAT